MIFKRKKSETQVKKKIVELDKSISEEILKERGNINQLYPSDFSDSEIEHIGRVKQYTMTSFERLVSLLRVVDYLEENNVEGNIVECGVWKGGSMMLVANKLKYLDKQERELFLFDTFEGMSEPSEIDVTFHNYSAKDLLESHEKTNNPESIWCYSTLDEVKNNLISTGYNKNKIHFIQGKVEDTLPYENIGKIALLRLDTDWYESTKHELQTLFDKLVIGGVLIVDDYGHWTGAKKAVDEFLKERRLSVFLHRVDYTCRLMIKNQ